MKKTITTTLFLVLVVALLFFWRGGHRWVLDFEHAGTDIYLTVSCAGLIPEGVTLVIPSSVKLDFERQEIEVYGMSDHLPVGKMVVQQKFCKLVLSGLSQRFLPLGDGA